MNGKSGFHDGTPRPRGIRRISGRLERSGLSPTQERHFHAAMWVLVLAFASGWTYAIAHAVTLGERPGIASRVTANPLGSGAPPEAAFALDAAMRAMLPPVGESRDVRVVVQEPGEMPDLGITLPEGAELEFIPAGSDGDTASFIGAPPSRSGIWNVAIRLRGAVREIPDLSVITTVPLAEAREGRLRGYRIGEWPVWRDLPASQRAAYAPPRSMIEVTPENMNLRVSRHFRLRDFLTKGQEDVWPKFVLMSPTLLDKLELTIDELERMGHRVENVGVISGFRHPHYNIHGGDPTGRGALSRHMYGDAMDFYIDNDRTGCMDDLNGDGRVDVADARIIAEAAERVERAHPNLIGGIGVYTPVRGSHCGFVHLDTRGWRARW